MTPALTVVSWLWAGWRDVYKAEHVNALERMLRAHLKTPHRFVCVTDQPAGIRCETIPLWDKPNIRVRPNYPNCYKRLRLFSDEARALFGERMLSIDLDCLLLRDITPLITEHDFRIVDGYSCPYNGSMWLLRAGSRPQVWRDFDADLSPAILAEKRMPDGRRYLGSDQAWLSYRIPGESVWKHEDGVYLFHGNNRTEEIVPRARIIFFPGHRKPWDSVASRKYKLIHAEYMRYL